LTVIRNGSPISNLVFFFNYAYLGATIYFIGILGVVIAFYLQYNRDLVLKEKEYERVMLLKGLGHDLKHPVLTAKLNNQFLLEGNLKDEERESVQISLKALARLDKMIENINDYFNQQSMKAMQEKMSLQGALKRIEDNHKNQTEHILIVKYAEEDCTININPISFYRIIDNLTDNAFKFNDAEKIVTISYEVSDYQVLITLEDNGKGLDKNEIHKVFDIFYRGEENRSVEGLGIGLSVVKQLVEGSGGEIWVQSQKNAGTIFTIRFPIEEFIAKG
jgi:signal transduction histidine kinase